MTTKQEDIDNLNEFLTYLERLLKIVVDARDILFDEELRQRLLDAWDGVVKKFPDIKQELDSLSQSKLQAKGLSGKEAEAKLFGFKRVFRAFRKFGGLKLLRRALKWADVILGSLASIIPGIDSIKEFKESVEAGLDDDPLVCLSSGHDES